MDPICAESDSTASGQMLGRGGGLGGELGGSKERHSDHSAAGK